jgi:hypothetical protein
MILIEFVASWIPELKRPVCRIYHISLNKWCMIRWRSNLNIMFLFEISLFYVRHLGHRRYTVPELPSIVLTKLRRGAIFQIVARYIHIRRKSSLINLYVFLSPVSHLINQVHKAYCWRRQQFYSSYAFNTTQSQLQSECHTTDTYSIYRSFRTHMKITVFIRKQYMLYTTHYNDFYLL